jgi:LytS/YehU family sensor histidine kinase
MSFAFNWKKGPDELGSGELENRRRIESVFESVFAAKGNWTGVVLEEDLLEFRVRFLDSGGNPQGPAITFSAMVGEKDVMDRTVHLR